MRLNQISGLMKKHNLIEDREYLEKNGTINENGNLITEKYGILTK